MNMLVLFKAIFTILAAHFITVIGRDFAKRDVKKESGNVFLAGCVGAVTNFLDALGIGSFATSTVLLRAFKLVPDKLLPGTLNAMCILPCLTEAFIYFNIIKVDFVTLSSMVATAACGGWLGAKYVSRLPEQKIRFVMSIALFLAASVMLLQLVNLFPSNYGTSIGLYGIKLFLAIFASFVIGMLCNIGIGFFAPCLMLTYFLGMSAKATFPIMMSAAAVSSYASALTFIRSGVYNRKISIAMAVCGVVGVIVAAFIVKSLPIHVLTWLVTFIIYYAAISLFCTFLNKRGKKRDDSSLFNLETSFPE